MRVVGRSVGLAKDDQRVVANEFRVHFSFSFLHFNPLIAIRRRKRDVMISGPESRDWKCQAKEDLIA